MSETIIPRLIDEEMKQSYLGYAMSVIVGRALPDVRDGLKPVHRRILFAMHDMGMTHDKPFKKSARIVGDVLGKYHPHGDSAIYDTMVRLVQTFSMRYPLINGHGNFGSVDGDSAAAMRYTEARMHKLAQELLEDIDKETVAWSPNFDGSLKEPTVLPAKVPNLLINGSSGIAVGMATSIPPHNLREVCAAVSAIIDNKDITTNELLSYISAPDFPTGGTIVGKSGIKAAYAKGRGKFLVRANHTIEEKGTKQRIIINEIPYQVNKAMLVEQIAHLARDKKVQGITDIRDESSDRGGMRIVLELKSGTNADVLLNQLYKHSRMQITFGIIFLALVNNEPKVLCLKDMLQLFVDHRFEMVTKRTQYDLKKAQERAHILSGLIIALDDIDTAIRLIKQSSGTSEAKTALTAHFKIDEIQAQAILDMKLQRLTSLEQDKIRKEHDELLKKISDLEAILADDSKVFTIIKEEMDFVVQKYGDDRRTQIEEGDYTDIVDEDLIKEEEMVVTFSNKGYLKRLTPDTYRAQKRGGRGVKGASTGEDDFISDIFVCSTHSYLLVFSNKGKIRWLKVHRIPEASRTARGTAVVNLLRFEKDETVSACIPVREFDEDKYLVFVTKHGLVKKTSLTEFSRPRNGGIVALSILDHDELINVGLTDGSQDVFMGTRNGLAIRFSEQQVRPMGRTAQGVRGIKLKNNDEVVDMVIAHPDTTLFTLTEKGYGKRTPLDEYRTIGRGGVGVINMKVTSKNGRVVAIRAVKETDEVMLISRNGIVIRTPVNTISVIGRSTQGVRVMRLDSGDEACAVAKIAQDESTDSE